jgi:hypothetical protein
MNENHEETVDITALDDAELDDVVGGAEPFAKSSGPGD